MSYLKHRAWPGVLALVCLLTVFLTVTPVPLLNGRASASAGPDLVIDSVSWSPVTPSIRDTVTFTATIRNQGDSQAAVSRIAYYIDDSFIGNAYINSIAAGDTAVNTITWQATAGDHFIKAIIDSDNVIAEANEDNNIKIYAFPVLAPDLIIESITWSPQNVSAGESVTFTVTAKNRGNKSSAPCWVEFFIDGSSRGQQEGVRLNPGEYKTFIYAWTTQPGQHTLKATVDVLNYSIESDETNNDLSATYATTPPDLIIYSIIQSPPNRTDIDPITMHVTVKNKGTGTAYNSWLNMYVDGVLESSISINSMNANTTDTRTYSWLPDTGEHTFTAIIDPDNQVYESNESNNTYTITLPAVALADLLIESITWTPTQPTINSRMTYTVTVKNAGKRAVNECYLDFYAEYSYKINKKLGPIPAGETASVNIDYLTSTEPLKVRAIIDPNNYIAESDETNNEKVASLTLAEPPAVDFLITSLTCTPQNPSVGDVVTITTKIKNNSTLKAGTSHLAYYVDGVMIEIVPIKSLGIKATVTNTITWTATPGTHTIRVFADYNDYNYESDEDNNAKEIVISVLSPDLAIKNITWSPEIPSQGDALTITFTIINQGTAKSDGCYLEYYIDGSYIGKHYIDEIIPGGTVTRTLPWNLANDSLTFKVIVDTENSVSEGDESNNEKVAVIPAPDLVIESITYSPDGFTENATVTFVIKVVNTGETQAVSPYLYCYINNVFQEKLIVNSLPAGSSAEILFSWTALAGQNVFKVIADAEDNIVEIDESNNENSVTLQTTVIEPPDESAVETTDNATSNETASIPPGTIDADDLPPALDFGIPSNLPINALDEISEYSGSGLPMWQDIMGNRWIVIGVGVLGGAGILVLLLLRKRSQTV